MENSEKENKKVISHEEYKIIATIIDLGVLEYTKWYTENFSISGKSGIDFLTPHSAVKEVQKAVYVARKTLNYFSDLINGGVNND